MKKLIAVLTLLLAFSINSNAQSKSTAVPSKKALTSQEKGVKDVKELSAQVGLNEAQTNELTLLFEQKHTASENVTLSEDRKKVLGEYMDSKLRTSLTETQMRKLDANPELLKRLTH